MTDKLTLDLIVKSIKQQYEKPTLLEIKHYAKMLSKNGDYKKLNYALNDISKNMGYRKFADYKPSLDERGIIVEFVFTFESDPTFNMPFSISIHCELFIDGSYEEIIKNIDKPYLVISEDLMYIQYSKNKIFALFSYSFNIVEPERAFSYTKDETLNNEIKIPKTIKELYSFLTMNRGNILFYYNQLGTISYDNKENGSIFIKLASHSLLKSFNIEKQNYKALIGIWEGISKGMDIEMDILFGNFSSKVEAEYYSKDAEAYLVKQITKNKIKVISRGKEFFVDDDSIIFKKIKDSKKRLMGKPLNPMDSNSLNIIKDSLNTDSVYHKQYMVELDDIEIIDYSLNELSQYFRDNFSFQVISNGVFEKKNTSKLVYNSFLESEIFFNRIREIFNKEKSLQRFNFEEIAGDIYENKENHSKEMVLTFKSSNVQEYQRLLNLFNKDSSHCKYNIEITSNEKEDSINICFEFCEQNYGEVPPNDFKYSNVSKKYIYRKFTNKKDIKNKNIRLGDNVKDSKGNTYLVDKYVDRDGFFLSCNQNLNKVHDLEDFKDSLQIL